MLSVLPRDLATESLTFLNIDELCIPSRVSKEWRGLCTVALKRATHVRLPPYKDMQLAMLDVIVKHCRRLEKISDFFGTLTQRQEIAMLRHCSRLSSISLASGTLSSTELRRHHPVDENVDVGVGLPNLTALCLDEPTSADYHVLPRMCPSLTQVGIATGLDEPTPPALFAEALIRLPHLRHLKVIGCGYTAMDALLHATIHTVCGVGVDVQTASAQRLRSLELSDMNVTDADCESLAQSTAAPNLTKLAIDGGDGVTYRGVVALARSARALVHLSVASTGAETQAETRALMSSRECFPALRVLVVGVGSATRRTAGVWRGFCRRQVHVRRRRMQW